MKLLKNQSPEFRQNRINRRRCPRCYGVMGQVGPWDDEGGCLAACDSCGLEYYYAADNPALVANKVLGNPEKESGAGRQRGVRIVPVSHPGPVIAI